MGALTDKYEAILKKQAWHKRLMEWHKDSHPLTKNADGTPKVFYHGTGADFDTFDRGDIGFHFGTQKSANDRLRHTNKIDYGNIMPVYLKAKNLIRLKDMRFWYDTAKIAKELYKESILNKDEKNQFTTNIYDKNAKMSNLREILLSKGYDGIIYKNAVENKGEDSFIVLSPNQIKSIHNKGTFDESSAVITDSVTLDMAPHRHHIAEKMIGIPQEIEKFGRNFTKFKGKPIEAIEHLIKVKNGQVRGAIYKEGIGDIDFIWGKILNPKKHTGYGLAHIIDKHGVEVARKLPKMINSLPIKNKTSNGVILEDTEQAERVSIQLKYIKKSKIWVLTAYNLDDDSSVVGDTATSMHLIPTLPCNKVGASKFTQIIPKNQNKVNMDGAETMNILQQIKTETGLLAKKKLLKQWRSLGLLQRKKALQEYRASTNAVNNDALDALETIKAVLENKNATYDDYKELESSIRVVEDSEDKLSDNSLYAEVISMLESMVEDATQDSILYGGRTLFDDVEMDTARPRRFQTYRAWKRAVKQLDSDADFDGDEDVDGAFKKGWYSAEWDGEIGELEILGDGNGQDKRFV